MIVLYYVWFHVMCVCSAGGKSDESVSLKPKRWTVTIHRLQRHIVSIVEMLSHWCLWSTHCLLTGCKGGLFIDLSLFSASTSVPSFSPSLFSLFFPPSNGWIFLERCSYYLLCIFEVQITLSQIINFSKIQRLFYQYLSSEVWSPHVW